MTPAFASLIDDTMHVKISNIAGDVVFCDEDVMVMDPGVEIQDCGGIGLKVDIDGNSIWLESTTPLSDGGILAPIFAEFTDMHWDNFPNGIITGVTIIPPSNVPIQTPIIGDHSITLTSEQLIIDCEGEEQCIVELHLDIETSHNLVGGIFEGVDTTSLLVAGAQMNASWMIPVIVSAAGIGLLIQAQKTKLKHNSCPSCKLESDDIFELGDKTVGNCNNPKCRVSLFFARKF